MLEREEPFFVIRCRKWWAYRVQHGDFRGFEPWENLLRRYIGHSLKTLEPILHAALRVRDDAMQAATTVWGSDKIERIGTIYVSRLAAESDADFSQIAFAFRDSSPSRWPDPATYYVSTRPLDWT